MLQSKSSSLSKSLLQLQQRNAFISPATQIHFVRFERLVPKSEFGQFCKHSPQVPIHNFLSSKEKENNIGKILKKFLTEVESFLLEFFLYFLVKNFPLGQSFRSSSFSSFKSSWERYPQVSPTKQMGLHNRQLDLHSVWWDIGYCTLIIDP